MIQLSPTPPATPALSLPKGALPTPALPKIAVRPESGAAVVEELRLLGALDALKRANEPLKISYHTGNAEVALILRRRPWFLEKGSGLTEPPAESLVLTLAEPDPMVALPAERAAYDQWHAAAVVQTQAEQARMQQLGMKDVQIPAPPHAFQPRWNKGNGYLYALAEALGLPLSLPVEGLRPFAEVARDEERARLKGLMKARIVDRPFVLYHFPEPLNQVALATTVFQRFPRLHTVSLNEVLMDVGGEVATLAALFAHPNCRVAVLPAEGLAALIAWAVGLPTMIALYAGANPVWDAPQVPNLALLEPGRYQPEQLPIALSQAALHLAPHV